MSRSRFVVWCAALVACCTMAGTSLRADVLTTGVGGGGAALTYTGPGNVVGSAFVWWGARAYSLAKAGTKAANVCNSGDANCADVNTLANGNFDVATATGAPLNCGGAGGTCTIKTIYDQSGANSCTATACDLVQTTIANRATLVLSCIGSLPCMGTTASTTYLTANTFTNTAQPFTISYVAEQTTANGLTCILSDNGTNDEVGFDAANTVYMFDNTLPTATAADNSFHAIQNVFNGSGASASSLYVDTTSNAETMAGTQLGTASKFAIGAGIGCGGTIGRIQEIGVWTSAFTVTGGGQASQMQSNQKTYWGYP